MRLEARWGTSHLEIVPGSERSAARAAAGTILRSDPYGGFSISQ